MFIGDLTTATEPSKYDGVVLCVDDIGQNLSSNAGQLCLKCGSGKLGSRALRMELPRIPLFISSLTFRNQTPKILFACSTGRDLAVGAALVVLCLFFDNDRTCL